MTGRLSLPVPLRQTGADPFAPVTAFATRFLPLGLAVLMLGVVAPVVHTAGHAHEQMAWHEAHHGTDADGHHHHETTDDHGTEAMPPCPEPMDAHVVCVLNKVSVAGVALPLASEAVPPVGTLGAAAVLAPHGPSVAASRARGPPRLA